MIDPRDNSEPDPPPHNKPLKYHRVVVKGTAIGFWEQDDGLLHSFYFPRRVDHVEMFGEQVDDFLDQYNEAVIQFIQDRCRMVPELTEKVVQVLEQTY